MWEKVHGRHCITTVLFQEVPCLDGAMVTPGEPLRLVTDTDIDIQNQICKGAKALERSPMVRLLRMSDAAGGAKRAIEERGNLP